MDHSNSLPDHILAEIFGNLSPRMIKCCALVCKRWDDIIGSSKELMGRFELNLRIQSREKNQEVKELQRNYQAAKILYDFESLDVIGQYNIKSLSLSLSYVKLSLIIEALNKLQFLKYLDVGLYDLSSEFVKDHKKITNDLVELTCNLDMIHLFDCCTVEILKLWYDFDDDDDKMKRSAVDFLRKQKNLKTLELYDGFDGEFFNLPGILELKFPLKKLAILNEDDPFQNYESLIKFLDCHKNSLTSLKLGFHTEPAFGIEFIHKFALENLVNLKHLELGWITDEDRLFDQELTYNELAAPTQITRNLEGLTTSGFSTDMNENRRFYDMFPNIKHLKLSGSDLFTNKILECINERCVNVESYEVDCIVGYSDIHFPNLKELIVKRNYDEGFLCLIIRRHSETLEKITIDAELNLAAKEIQKCPKLKYLKIASFCRSPDVFKILDQLSCKSTPFTLHVSRSKNPFKFPDDKVFWNEEFKDLRNNGHFSKKNNRILGNSESERPLRNDHPECNIL